MAADQLTTPDTMTDADYDLADAIEQVMVSAAADKSWTPSEMGRKVRADSTRVRNVLSWMAKHHHIEAFGNGCRTRYARCEWRILTFNS